MKVRLSGAVISTSDDHIKKYRTKEAFIKYQLEALKGILTEDQIKEVSSDMYDVIHPKKAKEDSD